MPIAIDLLKRIKDNDHTLKSLSLREKSLMDDDIQQLVDALGTNNTLIKLDVSSNKIGDKGAKALAENRTLTTLNISHNRVGAAGAQELAKNGTLATLNLRYNNIGDAGAQAFAKNSTLTSLDVGLNNIGAAGAQALATNPTLTTLDISYNKIGDKGAQAFVNNHTLTSLRFLKNEIESEEINKQVKEQIARNERELPGRRARAKFIYLLILLADDKANPNSPSSLSRLPQEIMLHIISFIDFHSAAFIGKNAQQIKSCATYIFNNIAQLKASLREASKTKQNFKIMEKIAQGKSQFTFFPLPPQLTSANIALSAEIENKHLGKIELSK